VTATIDGTIISCNQNCEELFGFKVSELVGKNLTVLMPPPHDRLHDKYIESYRRTGVAKVVGHVRNVPARHRSGVVFPVCLQVQHVKVGTMDLLRGTIDPVDNEAPPIPCREAFRA
jgi:PAS domain S-box-containing protein